MIRSIDIFFFFFAIIADPIKTYRYVNTKHQKWKNNFLPFRLISCWASSNLSSFSKSGKVLSEGGRCDDDKFPWPEMAFDDIPETDADIEPEPEMFKEFDDTDVCIVIIDDDGLAADKWFKTRPSSWVGVPGSSPPISVSWCKSKLLLFDEFSELVLVFTEILSIDWPEMAFDDIPEMDTEFVDELFVKVGVAVIMEGVAVVTSCWTGVVGVEFGLVEVLDTRLNDL